MKKLLLILFLLPFFCFSQGKDTTYYRLSDLNKDGYLDTVRTIEHCCYTPSDFHIVNGRSGQETGFYSAFRLKESKSDFLNIVPIDNRLFKPENKAFLDSIESFTFGEKYQKDASLDFLIHAYKTQVFFPKGDTIFSTSYGIQNTIIESPEILFPSYSYKLLKTEDNPLLYNRMTDLQFRYGTIKDTTDYFWINYIGMFHDTKFYKGDRDNSNRLDTVSIHKNYVLLKTSHGIVQKYKNRYRWIYTNDGSLTGGPGKLRWSSIKEVYQKDNYVFVIQDGAIYGYYRIFIVDLKKNKVFCYKEDVENWCGLEPSFREMKKKIFIDFTKENEDCTNDREVTLVFDRRDLKNHIKTVLSKPLY